MKKRILSCGLAAVVVIHLAQSVYAGGGSAAGGSFGSGASVSVSGGHSGGGSSAHSGAPSGAATHSSSSGSGGHYGYSANPATHSVTGVGTVPSGFHASTAVAHASTAVAPAIGHASPATAAMVNVNRAFAPARTSDPTIAFGGSITALHGGGRAFSPSGDVTRNWDRGHCHTWNHHCYRYYGGGWIYWDGGFPYDDFANTGNDYAPYPYPTPANGAVNDEQPPANGGTNSEPPSAHKSSAFDGSDYGTPDTLIVSVQDALTHRGYATGVSNGTFGPMTETALSNFQRDHQLPVTGRIDGMTLKALGLL